MRVIKRIKDSNGDLVNLKQPTDDAELKEWTKSECRAMGVILVTAQDLHYELISIHEDHAGSYGR